MSRTIFFHPVKKLDSNPEQRYVSCMLGTEAIRIENRISKMQARQSACLLSFRVSNIGLCVSALDESRARVFSVRYWEG